MSTTYYIFSRLFCLPCPSQVAASFTVTPQTSVRLLLIKCLSSKPTKKLLVKFGEHTIEEAFFDGMRGDLQLGHFVLLSVPVSQ